jgi:hypothetical protein
MGRRWRIRRYQMTVAGRGYDEEGKRQLNPELHFEVSRRGKIRIVRRHLAKRGVEYYQQRMYREFGFWIPRRKIRVGFMPEEPASKPDRAMHIEAFALAFRGKRTRAVQLPTRTLPYAKRKNKHGHR